MSLDESQVREIRALRIWAAIVVSWLVLFIVVSLGLAVALLAGSLAITVQLQEILICVAAATLGSGISALVSAAERISHGWEFSGGQPYPAEEPKGKFVARMIPFFMVRPFLGSAMGLLVYAGLTSGYPIAIQNAGQQSFSPPGLFFLAFLGGLFAKTFIEKLRAMFDTLFGK